MRQAPYEILRRARFDPKAEEYDRESIWHAVPHGSWSALCGVQPGGRAERQGWSIPEGDYVTCRHCLAILTRHPGLSEPPAKLQ